MNTPNPLIPQGSIDRQSKNKSTVRIAIFTIISIHAVFFAGLLMQGCRQDDAKTGAKVADALTNQNTLPAMDSGYYPSTQDVAQATPSTTLPSTPATNLTPTVTDSVQPPPAALSPAELGAEGKSYTVVKGDTLSKIARANGVTIAAITKANQSMDLGKLRPGQKIQIPAPTAPATAGIGFKEPGTTTAAGGTAHIYTVKAGETLTRIAKQHGTTTKALRAANNLKSDRVYVGQKLKLPAAQSASASKSVKPITKLSATNPAHVSPPPSTAAGTNTH